MCSGCRPEDLSVGGGVDPLRSGRAGVSQKVLDDGQSGSGIEDGAAEMVAGVVGMQGTAET
jgi:hypothetical protein